MNTANNVTTTLSSKEAVSSYEEQPHLRSQTQTQLVIHKLKLKLKPGITMSRYHNPIHPPVFPSQLSSYSTLSGALIPPPSRFTSARRKRVPQILCKTNSGPICPPIMFDYIGQTGQGVSVADLSTRSQNALAQMITGANDLVLANTGVKSLNVYIMWTGYEHLSKSKFSIPVSATMSRGQLGASIATQLWAFVDGASKAPSTHNQWEISAQGIRYDKIMLVALYHVGDDVWQVDLAVDF